MSDNTAIEWSDATWNFLVGCSKVSAGCKNCYAIRSVARMSGNPQFGERYQGLVTVGQKPLNWTGKVAYIPDKLALPLTWKQPRRIFVNSLSDLFHPDVPDEVIAACFGVMAATPQHTYQILTKRPERMRTWIEENSQRLWGDSTPTLRWCIWQAHLRVAEDPLGHMLAARWTPSAEVPAWPLPNVWLGTSVEDQRAADERIPHLLATPAAVRFLSCEPLLGPVDLRSYLKCRTCSGYGWIYHRDGTYASEDCPDCHRKPIQLHWVITGGESGPKARPMDPAWALSLRDQCAAAGVAYFHKQNGGRTAKANGRLLDGREWSEFPETTVAGATS